MNTIKLQTKTYKLTRFVSSSCRRGSKGFTLIEMMVAISIFAIVMLIVVGALLALNNANKKAQALRAVVDNLNFAVEDMTRNIKTGGEYSCGVSLNGGRFDTIFASKLECNRPGVDIKGIVVRGELVTSSGTPQRECYVYYFDNSSKNIKYMKALGRNEEDGCLGPFWSSYSPSNLISPEVIINNASFKVVNTGASDSRQPIVIINIDGEINLEQYFKFPTPFAIQTTVSQRSSVQN